MYVGIDIGGTTARLATFDSSDDPTIRDRTSFELSGNYRKDLAAIVAAVQKRAKSVTAVGLATPGRLTGEGGTLADSPNLPGWEGHSVSEDLAAQVGEVRFINDAQAAALAEATFGDHPDADFWFIIWGTGVGGSLVRYVDQDPIITDAEPGHQILNWQDSSPPAGELEEYIGGAGMAKRYGKPAADLAEAEWNEVCDWFARGLYNIIRVSPVENVVVGGGVAIKQATRLPAIEQRLNQYLDGFRTVKLTPATHGEDAGLVGALALLRESS